MGKLMSFSEATEAKKPHMAGKAICIQCKHEWVAVAPIGTTLLACPKCGCHAGVFSQPVSAEEVLACEECGNTYSQIGKNFTYCARCGTAI